MVKTINASSSEDGLSSALKEAVIHTLLKETTLDNWEMANCKLVLSFPLENKIIEPIVAEQIQDYLNETSSLDLCQLGFIPIPSYASFF